jgi:hypothetical protein
MLLDRDRELGTDDLAQTASDALASLSNIGRMIALQIEALGSGKDFTRTELDAVRASFAAFLQHVHGAGNTGQSIRIEGLAPVAWLGGR